MSAMRSTRSWLPKAMPWLPPDYDDAVLYAWRALFDGKATEHQQKMAVGHLMYITGASEEFQDLSFRPGEEGRRATDFAEGKRFVGIQVRKYLRPELTPRGEHEVDVPKAAKPKRQRKK